MTLKAPPFTQLWAALAGVLPTAVYTADLTAGLLAHGQDKNAEKHTAVRQVIMGAVGASSGHSGGGPDDSDALSQAIDGLIHAAVGLKRIVDRELGKPPAAPTGQPTQQTVEQDASGKGNQVAHTPTIGGAGSPPTEYARTSTEVTPQDSGGTPAADPGHAATDAPPGPPPAAPPDVVIDIKPGVREVNGVRQVWDAQSERWSTPGRD